VSTNDYFYAPRLASCHKNTGDVTVLHQVNLAMLQHFFDESHFQNIFGNTNFAKAVNVSLPKIELYEHDMTSVLANDQKAHLSLSKMADLAKDDKKIFQSLTESLLDGEIAINTKWPTTDDILLIASFGLTVLVSVGLIWTILKIRKLSATILMLQKIQKCHSLVTDVPTFIYKSPRKTDSDVSTFNININLSWEQANFILLVFTLILIFVCVFKFWRLRRKSKLCLEITS
jgi:hypothetical protein